MFSEWHAAEVDRLVRAYGYDRLSPVVTPREAHNKANTVMFSPLRPSSLGQLSDAEASGIDPMLTHDLVDGAIGEIAVMHPLLDVETVRDAVLALSGGERDVDSLVRATAELVRLSGYDPREIQRLALAADVSAEERRELARRGHALPSGKYPIPDVTHLHSAAVLAASGHGTPEELAAARALIKKMAAHFGVDLHSLPGFSQDDEDLKEQVQRDRKRRRAAHHGEAPRHGMAKPYQPGSVVPAHASGTPYHHAAPRIAVWAETPLDVCWRCSWSVRQRPDGSWCRFLLAVHGTCPEHRELSRSFVQPRLDAPGSVLTPATGAREAAPAGED